MVIGCLLVSLLIVFQRSPVGVCPLMLLMYSSQRERRSNAINLLIVSFISVIFASLGLRFLALSRARGDELANLGRQAGPVEFASAGRDVVPRCTQHCLAERLLSRVGLCWGGQAADQLVQLDGEAGPVGAPEVEQLRLAIGC